MAGKKNPNLGDMLRQEREGAENTLRDSRSKTADTVSYTHLTLPTNMTV